jgi:hypothetical protein
MNKSMGIICTLLATASVAMGDGVLVLSPSDPGPYVGGESLTVDVWLTNQDVQDHLVTVLVLDSAGSDPALVLDVDFSFDLSSLDSDGLYTRLPTLPLPTLLYTGAAPVSGFILELPTQEPLHVGDLGVTLPTAPGTYLLDLVNTLGSVGLHGAGNWSAGAGTLTGGTCEFVVPEPGCLWLFGLGAALLMRRRRTP